MKSGIYCIQNKITNQVYIGSSNHLMRRKNEHFYQLKLNKHKNQKLQNTYNKYGENIFDWFVIEYNDDTCM